MQCQVRRAAVKINPSPDDLLSARQMQVEAHMEFGQIVKVGDTSAVYLYEKDGCVITFDIVAFAAGRSNFSTVTVASVEPLALDTFEPDQLVWASVEGKLMLVQYVEMENIDRHVVQISPGQMVTVTHVRRPTPREAEVMFPQFTIMEH